MGAIDDDVVHALSDRRLPILDGGLGEQGRQGIDKPAGFSDNALQLLGGQHEVSERLQLRFQPVALKGQLANPT